MSVSRIVNIFLNYYLLYRQSVKKIVNILTCLYISHLNSPLWIMSQPRLLVPFFMLCS